MKHNFEERKQKRIDFARQQAEKNDKLSDDLYNEAKKMAFVIPMGQPILVGHHSERSDRNYRKRIDNKYRKSFEASDKASYYKEKAEAIESNTAISSDDPEAVQKLKAQLESLERNQDFMKAANACIRKKDKDGFLKLAHATQTLWEEVNKPDYLNRVGFPSYALSNNNANIRRVKNRITQLERMEKRPAQDIAFDGGCLLENAEVGRVQFLFDERPDKDTCKMLRRHGFIWAPSQKAWQRHLNPNGVYAAKQVLKNLTEPKADQ